MPSDPAFLFHVYQDQAQAVQMLDSLRTYYLGADIIGIGDGETLDPALCAAFQVNFFQGDRLKLMTTGSQWIERMFTTYLENSLAPYLIKLDPDSRMHRAFASIPQADWFGEVSRDNRFFRPLVRGGCVGFSRSLVECILNSNLLHNPIYTRLPFGYLWRPDAWVSFTDGIIADVCFRLGVSPQLWTEVYIRFRETIPPGLPHAVTHPHV